MGALGWGITKLPFLHDYSVEPGGCVAARYGANKIQQIYSKTTAIMLYINLQQFTKVKYYKLLILNWMDDKYRWVQDLGNVVIIVDHRTFNP